jgi:O-antigen/teichoic acid export membrane protein
MKKHIHTLLNKDDGLLKAGMIFLFGAFFTAVGNYLYQLFMGRSLGPEGYGILGTLFAVIYIVQMGSGTILTVVSHYTSTYFAKNDYSSIKRLVKVSFKYIALFGGIIFIIYALLTGFIAKFLNLDNRLGLLLVGILGLVTLFQAIINGYLNGLQRFVFQNVLSVISVLLKLILGIALVILGFGVNGAVLGMVIAFSIAIIIGLFALRFKSKNLSTVKSYKSAVKRSEILQYAFPVLITTLIPALIITFDILLVKHFFSSQDAGFYVAAGFIAKIVWFASGFIVSAMFPKIVYLATKNKNVSGLFRSALLYNFLIGFGIVGLYFLIPKLIVNTMYGAAYDISGIIGLFGIAMALFSLNNVFIMYNLALKKYKFIWSIVTGIIFEVVLISIWHSHIIDVVYSLIVVNAGIFASFCIINWKDITER